MPALTIGRMAKLYGLHRSTLYEAVEKGRVTAGFNGKNQRVIDLSEMIRVYGEPPGQARQNPTDPTPSADTDPTPDSYRELVEELRALRQEVRELKEQMRLLPAPEQSTAKPRGQLRPLGAPPEPPEKPRERKNPSTPTNPPPEGGISFADIEKRLAERLSRQS
ncbi:hypothetical protein [Modicisalibacter sp. 'Wilcox']|uniref:hypothetical protein n=1 Tax=Modicisalibacter sp. 'Wilcox' TaxID=2679914 RepID=UPI001969DA5C|nr:hypothetical protein [Modicisalibacter sp. 'Wilcox']